MSTAAPEGKVFNPETGNYINIGGKAFQDLLKRGDYEYLERQNQLVKIGKRARKGALRAKRSQRGSARVEWPIAPGAVERAVALGVAEEGPSLQELLEETRQPYLRRTLEQQLGRETEGRGGRTRGWRALSPKRGRERHRVREVCGDACFLQPEREGFPICPRCLAKGGCSCKVDCRGVLAAKIRARQYKYDDVAEAAESIGRKLRCPWVGER